MNIKIILAVIYILLVSCSNDTDIDVSNIDIPEQAPFPKLPTGSSPVELNGIMVWWFWEGDGGCMGTISDGKSQIELWSSADDCEPIEYNEGDPAKVQVIYSSDNQYGAPGQKMYTIIKFLK